MEDDAFNKIKAQLDAELAQADKHVGIGFGDELYAEFVKRDLISLRETYLLGIMRLPFQLPAYAETHYAVPHWACAPTEYVIGTRG